MSPAGCSAACTPSSSGPPRRVLRTAGWGMSSLIWFRPGIIEQSLHNNRYRSLQQHLDQNRHQCCRIRRFYTCINSEGKSTKCCKLLGKRTILCTLLQDEIVTTDGFVSKCSAWNQGTKLSKLTLAVVSLLNFVPSYL